MQTSPVGELPKAVSSGRTALVDWALLAALVGGTVLAVLVGGTLLAILMGGGALLAVLLVGAVLAVLLVGGVWRLGIEYERAWLRSYDGPLLGDLLVGSRGGMPPSIGVHDERRSNAARVAGGRGGRARSLAP
jgi:hypothetical protein